MKELLQTPTVSSGGLKPEREFLEPSAASSRIGRVFGSRCLAAGSDC
jgi:hypothetical protein